MNASVLRLAARVAPSVPPSVGYKLTAIVADLAYLLAGAARRQVRHNLDIVLGASVRPRARRRAVRAAFQNLLFGYYELLRLPTTDLARLEDRAAVSGLEHLDVDEGTGAIVVFAHVGNLEVLSRLALRWPNRRFVVVVERLGDPTVQALTRRLRRSHGLELVHADQPVELLRRFRSGAHVILAGDLASTGRAVTVPLFGRPARLPYGAVKLALRTGAPLLFVAGWRESLRTPERFRVEVSEPVALSGSPNSSDDIRAGVTRVAELVETIVAARPEQWLAFRPVWTT